MLREFVDAQSGFARKRDLVAIGATDRMLTAAVRTRILTRVRNGWYTTRPPSDPAVRAVRVGGRLTGMSALEPLGVWRWSQPTVLHVAVRRTDARLRRAGGNRRRRWVPGADAGVRVHWEGDDALDEGDPWSVGVVPALVRAVLDEPFEQAVIALDWAWASGHIDLFDFERVIAALPADLRGIRDWVDPASQSILETTSRVRARLAGHRVRSQVPVDGEPERIDLVIDDIAALELDGREFHEATFESDRRKDLRITIEGRHALRVSYTMIRDDWSEVLLALESAITARLGSVAPRFPVGNSGMRMLRQRRRCRGRWRAALRS